MVYNKTSHTQYKFPAKHTLIENFVKRTHYVMISMLVMMTVSLHDYHHAYALELNQAYQIYLQRLFEGSAPPPTNAKGQIEPAPGLIVIREYLKILRQEDRTRVLKDATLSLKKIARVIREQATQKQIRLYYEMQRTIELELENEQQKLDISFQNMQKILGTDVRPLNHPLVYQEWLPNSINQAINKAQQNNADVLVAQNILQAATEAARGYRGNAFETNLRTGGNTLSQPIENLFQARLRFRDTLQKVERQISIAWNALNKARIVQENNVKDLNEDIKLRDDLLGKLYTGQNLITEFLRQEQVILQKRLENLVSHYDHFFSIYFMLNQTGELTGRLAPVLNSQARLQIKEDARKKSQQIPLIPENGLSSSYNEDNNNSFTQQQSYRQTQDSVNNLDTIRYSDAKEHVLQGSDKIPSNLSPTARDLGRAAATHIKNISHNNLDPIAQNQSQKTQILSDFKKISKSLISDCSATLLIKGEFDDACRDNIGEDFLVQQAALTHDNNQTNEQNISHEQNTQRVIARQQDIPIVNGDNDVEIAQNNEMPQYQESEDEKLTPFLFPKEKSQFARDDDLQQQAITMANALQSQQQKTAPALSNVNANNQIAHHDDFPDIELLKRQYSFDENYSPSAVAINE